MIKLETYIQSKVNLQEEVLREVLSAFGVKEFKNDQAIIKKGQYVTKYYFIAKGGIRIVLDELEKEITAWLLFEDNFFTDLEAIRTGTTSKSKILSVGDTEICSIDAQKMFYLFECHPEWQKFGRLIMEDVFLNVVETLISFQVMDAESRYLQLLEKSDLIHKVPLKQLASYLGITPNSLSRIRKNISKNP